MRAVKTDPATRSAPGPAVQLVGHPDGPYRGQRMHRPVGDRRRGSQPSGGPTAQSQEGPAPDRRHGVGHTARGPKPLTWPWGCGPTWLHGCHRPAVRARPARLVGVPSPERALGRPGAGDIRGPLPKGEAADGRDRLVLVVGGPSSSGCWPRCFSPTLSVQLANASSSTARWAGWRSISVRGSPVGPRRPKCLCHKR